MTDRPSQTTLGELRAGGYRPRSVKEEMRANLLARLRDGVPFLPGILGYDETVLPQIENAVLAGQDIILLGERGQAKSRIARSLVALLDEWVPEVAGAELHDDPLRPVSAHARARRGGRGRRAPRWPGCIAKTATARSSPPRTSRSPTWSGEVDPVKVAEGRYLSDELTIHYGLLPRTNRGIFTLNELPDLAERIQVGLLNLMEERDVQIRGYKVRLELDLFVVASANPEDYTSRGRIITPLKDRFGAQIRTHYPEDPETEIAIIEAERTAFDDATATSIPVQVPGVHERDRGRAVAARAPLVGGQPALRGERAGHDRQPRDADGRRAQACGAPGRAGGRAARQRPAGASWPRPPARSSSRRWATRRARRRSSRSSCSARS